MNTETINELTFKHPKDKNDFNAFLHNCELFLKLWKDRVTPELVIKDLREWSCGTQACAGGHMATWPEFKAIGGLPDYTGSPELEIDGCFYDGNELPLKLFNNPDLFFTRSRFGVDFDIINKEPGISDYDLVVRRFENHIKYLKNI